MKTSISRIKLFKACQRAYFFKYVEGLEPVQKAEALQTGQRYHELIEALYKEGNTLAWEDDHSKELAMAVAYWKYIYPKFNVKVVEEWKERQICYHTLIGRVDGIAEDGGLVEHKTTSQNLDEYEYGLQWDEQILAYMFITGARHVWYTVIQKPTIRLKKDETEEEFFDRMVTWYDVDTNNKIRLLKLERTDEQVIEGVEELTCSMNSIDSMKNAPMTEYVKNTCYCNHWGRRCEYAGICLSYDPNNEYVEYVKGERNYGVDENQ